MRINKCNKILLYSGFFIFTFVGCTMARPGLESRKNFLQTRGFINQEIKQAILEGKVIEGMTRDEVQASWGKPNEISDATTSKFLIEGEESWEYERSFAIPIHIHFKNGTVESVNDSIK